MIRSALALTFCCHVTILHAAELRGRIVDADKGHPLAARVYLQNAAGEDLFVETADAAGSALPYREQWVPLPGCSEKHTTVSPHPFRIDLDPGSYQLTVERGKDYLPLSARIHIDAEPIELTLKLQRFADPAARGWYSGETHVHRRIPELPNVMQAEDLNVAFPVAFWTTTAAKAPDLEPSPLRRQGPSPFGPRLDRGTDPIYIDKQHVIVPRNTEYEIFSLGEGRHTLGAIFLLNHKTVFTKTAPPIQPIAEQAHAEGALLDLDKHSWPWSMMLVPIAQIDLFELSNNSVWRTDFGFKRTQVIPAEWMNLEYEAPELLTEWGWLNFGWEVYYSLLNCGYRISPTAGTASGVHPVPLGHSRVYVQTGADFSLESFLDGLKHGRSFVTTGPMLFATANGHPPGEVFSFEAHRPQKVQIQIESLSERRISQIEILVNGKVVHSLEPELTRLDRGGWQALAQQEVELSDSGWIVVRSVQPQPDGRKRFAHTAPWYLEMAERPVTPPLEQVDYFIGLMQAQIERNREVLTPEALAEFERALRAYQSIRERATAP